MKLFVILSILYVLIGWTCGTSRLLVRIASFNTFGMKLYYVWRFHTQMKTTHTIFGTGTILEDHIISTTSMAPTPWRYGISFDRHLRIGDQWWTLWSCSLRLDEKCSLIFNREVTCQYIYKKVGRDQLDYVCWTLHAFQCMDKVSFHLQLRLNVCNLYLIFRYCPIDDHLLLI